MLEKTLFFSTYYRENITILLCLVVKGLKDSPNNSLSKMKDYETLI